MKRADVEEGLVEVGRLLGQHLGVQLVLGFMQTDAVDHRATLVGVARADPRPPECSPPWASPPSAPRSCCAVLTVGVGASTGRAAAMFSAIGTNRMTNSQSGQCRNSVVRRMVTLQPALVSHWSRPKNTPPSAMVRNAT